MITIPGQDKPAFVLKYSDQVLEMPKNCDLKFELEDSGLLRIKKHKIVDSERGPVVVLTLAKDNGFFESTPPKVVEAPVTEKKIEFYLPQKEKEDVKPNISTGWISA